jgi:hypothetical protein
LFVEPRADIKRAIVSTRAVGRVVGIGRVAVDADITAITAQLDLPLRRLAQRL